MRHRAARRHPRSAVRVRAAPSLAVNHMPQSGEPGWSWRSRRSRGRRAGGKGGGSWAAILRRGAVPGNRMFERAGNFDARLFARFVRRVRGLQPVALAELAAEFEQEETLRLAF